MFITEATAQLPHSPARVAALLGRAGALSRWCAGVRRARLAGGAFAPCGPASCALLYVTRDLRLALVARTVSAGPLWAAASLDGGDGAGRRAIVHVAEGDGLTLTWAFDVAAEPPVGGAPPAGAPAHTRLHARTTLVVDEAHPTAAYRTALFRLVARRAPDDLARLGALLDRRAAARAPLPAAVLPAWAPGAAPAPRGAAPRAPGADA
jgi:hypothetical protein